MTAPESESPSEPAAESPSGSALTRREFLGSAGKAAAAAGVIGALGATSALLASCASSAQQQAAAAWPDLAARLPGKLLQPGDAGYEAKYLPNNLRYSDIKPQGIVTAVTAQDVQTCVNWARENGVPIAVRSGGHSYAGYSTGTGLVVDLGEMRAASADGNSARVTTEPGARNTDLYTAMQKYNVAISAGRCPDVAVGGLVLGGGFGFSSRLMGLTCDSLIETTIVTADGELLVCNDRDNSDLFWACRGAGGGNYGINTSYTFQAQQVPHVSVFDLSWAEADAAAALSAMQERIVTAPNTFSLRMGSGRDGTASGAGGAVTTSALGQFFGPVNELRDMLAPVIKNVPPSSAMIKNMTFWQAKDYLFHDVPTDRYEVKSSYIARGMPQSGFDLALEYVKSWPGSTNTEDGGGFAMFAMGGEIDEVGPADTAFVHRDAAFVLAMSAAWTAADPQASVDANLAWIADFGTAMAPFSNGHAYQNFIDRSQPDWQYAYYGSNLERLTQIKTQRDPGNLFRFDQSIPVGQ